MNSRLIQVFFYEFKRNVRRKGYLFATFGIPLLGFLSMFAFQGISQSTLDSAVQLVPELLSSGLNRAGYIDETGILDQPDGGLGQVIIEFADTQSAESALSAGEIDTYFVIPPDFFETGNATQILAEMSLTQMGSNSILKLMRANIGDNIEPDLVQRLQNPSDLTIINLSRESEFDAQRLLEGDMIMIYVFALVFLMAIFVTNGYLMQSIAEEKETHLIEIIMSSLKPMELLAGKIMAMGLLGMIQVAIWLGAVFISVQLAGNLSALATTVIAQIRFPVEQLPMMLAYLILGYLFFATGYSMIGAIAGSMRDGQQFIALLIVPAITPFFFFTIIAETPNQTLPVILSMIPLTSPLAMIMRLSIGPVAVEQIVLSLSILSISVVGMIWLTARIFRFQILLSGQTPRLRDLPKLIRG